ncbi:MAG: hypothetical protein JW704_11170, partial [Anaerolineaceae bacterium]|nr:hypothetical protein [Anaerolineaceae bacterium]
MAGRKHAGVLLVLVVLCALFMFNPTVSIGQVFAPESKAGPTLRAIEDTVLDALARKGLDPERHRRNCLERRQRAAAFTRWNETLHELHGLLSGPITDPDGLVRTDVINRVIEFDRVLVETKATLEASLEALDRRLVEDRVSPLIRDRLERVRRRFKAQAAPIVTVLERDRTLLEQAAGSGPQQRTGRSELATRLPDLKARLERSLPVRQKTAVLGSEGLPFSAAESDYRADSFEAQTNSAGSSGWTDLLEEPVTADTVNTAETALDPVL